MFPTQRPSCSPVAPPVKASHRPLPEGAIEAPRPAPALTAASLHIVLSSGRPWSSPGLMAAAATQRSAGPMLRLSPRRLPPRARAGLPAPLRTVAAPVLRARARAVSAAPAPGWWMCEGECVCEWMWERARSCGRGSPRSPAERGAGGGGGQAAPSKPLAVGPAPRQAFSSPLPGGSPESSRPPWFTELAQPGSRGVLLLRSPRRKRRRKAGGPPTPTWGLILSRRDAAAPAKAEKVWSSGGRESLQSAAALPGGGPRQTPQSLGGGADRGHRLPERTAAVRPG